MTLELPTRALELLADRTVGQIDHADERELHDLLAERGMQDEDSIDRAAAAALVALMPEPQPMPEHLRQSLLASIRTNRPAPDLRLADAPAPARAPARPQVWAWTGWLAAAACLLLALLVTFRAGPTAADPNDARARFLATAADLRSAEWGAWDDPEQPGVSGRVEWSETEQKGFMVFEGLRSNDPTEEQYQLWIIDERGLEQRISGGIFNSPDAQGRVVVEIDPAVEIHNAAAFAVTIERPGGVWVSDMSRRVVIAALPEAATPSDAG